MLRRSDSFPALLISEIRSEVTDADGKPVVTSVVTMLGESAHQAADTSAATIASMRAGA